LEWSVLPHLILNEISMIFVVAMSSSLDVAAIELEVKRPLDYNGELKMVGLSNLVSGLTGGYTGSYIFSQSIFSLRSGIKSSAAGYVLATTQLLFFLSPFPILMFVPNFFFGPLLSLICVDLMYEWLWDVRHKVTPVEYLICLGTFVSIQFVGVQFGILLGLAVYVACQKIGLHVGAPKTITTPTDDEKNDHLKQRSHQQPARFGQFADEEQLDKSLRRRKRKPKAKLSSLVWFR
jgi:MFS superfamily sulfate permease-like transporter